MRVAHPGRRPAARSGDRRRPGQPAARVRDLPAARDLRRRRGRGGSRARPRRRGRARRRSPPTAAPTRSASGPACASRRRPARRSRPRRSAASIERALAPGFGPLRGGAVAGRRHRRRRCVPGRPRPTTCAGSWRAATSCAITHRPARRRLPRAPRAAVLLRRAGGDAGRPRRRRRPRSRRAALLRRVARRRAARCSSATPHTPASRPQGPERIVYDAGLPTARATAELDGGRTDYVPFDFDILGPLAQGGELEPRFGAGQRGGGRRTAALLREPGARRRPARLQHAARAVPRRPAAARRQRRARPARRSRRCGASQPSDRYVPPAVLASRERLGVPDRRPRPRAARRLAPPGRHAPSTSTTAAGRRTGGRVVALCAPTSRASASSCARCRRSTARSGTIR